MLVCPGLPWSDGPTPARQSGNKEVDWEPLSVLFTNRNIPLRTVATVENPQYPQQTFISPLISPRITVHTDRRIFLHLFCMVRGEWWGWGEGEHYIANKSINQPKSGKVCLVMSSDWSHGSPPQWMLRNKSNENWKTAHQEISRYQSQLQYLIFDCGITGKVGGVFCTKYQILMAEINFAVQIVIAIKPDTGTEFGGGTWYQFILCRNILGEVEILTSSIFEKNNNKKCRLEINRKI